MSARHTGKFCVALKRIIRHRVSVTLSQNSPRACGACLAFTVAAAISAAEASEGLASAGAYLCDPIRVTLAAAQMCAARLPERSDKYTGAYQKWLQRNDRDIARLNTECKTEARRLANDDSKLQNLMRQVEAVNAEAIEEMTKRGEKEKEGLCADLLLDMETGRSDLGRYLPFKR